MKEETRIQSLKAKIKMMDRQLKIALANQKQHERKALNKRKFVLGGLCVIVWPVGDVDEGLLLGALMEVAASIKKDHVKAAEWKKTGSAVLQKRYEEQLAKKKKTIAATLILTAPEDDAPFCPACSVGKIVPRPALGGKLGCNNYPMCKYVAPIGE